MKTRESKEATEVLHLGISVLAGNAAMVVNVVPRIRRSCVIYLNMHELGGF